MLHGPLAVEPISTAGPTRETARWIIGSLASRAATSFPDRSAEEVDVSSGKRGKYVEVPWGRDDGRWNVNLTGPDRATTPLPPVDFAIKQYILPTPADQCADLVKTKKVEEMPFAEWQLCLSEAARRF